MKKLAVSILLLALFAVVCFAQNETKINYIPIEKDQTLTVEAYYKLGIPKSITTPDDIVIIFDKLQAIQRDDPKKLPRYNSRKSGRLFHYLTDFESIDRILSSFKTYPERQKFLYDYANNRQYLTVTYLLAGNYPNECLLSRCSVLYARLRSMQMAEEQLELSGQSYDDIGIDRSKRVVMTKIVGREFWGIEHLNNKSTDPYVRQTVKKHLPVLKRMITALKMIDHSIVFDMDKCFEEFGTE
ncbi:MAG TPA: hypothetical protein VHR47_12135 [Bacillota bacterium]|nr:hypothetical protein [Bacillota bacterium]